MDPEQLRTTVRRWLVGIWDDGNFALLDELATQEYVYEGFGHGALQGQQFRDLVSGMREAFPDLRNIIEEQVPDGNTVVTRGKTRGTQRGTLGALAATGKAVTVPWVIVTKFANGRIVRDWELYDAQGMMTQLGVGVCNLNGKTHSDASCMREEPVPDSGLAFACRSQSRLPPASTQHITKAICFIFN